MLKRFILSLCLLLILLPGQVASAQMQFSSKDSLAIKSADWNFRPVGEIKGKSFAEAGSARVEMFGGVQHISIIRYQAKKYHTEIFVSNGKDADLTSKLAKKSGASMAVNASYFSGDLYPVTFVKDNGKECGFVKAIEPHRMRGMLMFSKDGKSMDIQTVEPQDYTKKTKDFPEAIISGPILIEEGVVADYRGKVSDSAWESFYGKRHPRTIIGYDKKGYFWMIVIDGRSEGNADGADIAESAMIASCLGLYEAINLDGGGSSTIWSKETGVLNHPTDNKAFDNEGERVVPNIIIAR